MMTLFFVSVSAKISNNPTCKNAPAAHARTIPVTKSNDFFDQQFSQSPLTSNVIVENPMPIAIPNGVETQKEIPKNIAAQKLLNRSFKIIPIEKEAINS